MRKIILSLIILLSVSTITSCNTKVEDILDSDSDSVKIETIEYGSDINQNGIDDLKDIIVGARVDVDKKTEYKSAYYNGGYPPDTEGVCTDVVWRALKNAGIDLKSEMDKDIKANTSDYRDGITKPDPNIDFRRVKNQAVFFEKYYLKLTTKLDVNDVENLKEWQAGDIIIKQNGEHVSILSDKRNKKGVPLVLHNYYGHATEDDYMEDWYDEGNIVGHYRLDESKYK